MRRITGASHLLKSLGIETGKAPIAPFAIATIHYIR